MQLPEFLSEVQQNYFNNCGTVCDQNKVFIAVDIEDQNISIGINEIPSYLTKDDNCYLLTGIISCISPPVGGSMNQYVAFCRNINLLIFFIVK